MDLQPGTHCGQAVWPSLAREGLALVSAEAGCAVSRAGDIVCISSMGVKGSGVGWGAKGVKGREMGGGKDRIGNDLRVTVVDEVHDLRHQPPFNHLLLRPTRQSPLQRFYHPISFPRSLCLSLALVYPAAICGIYTSSRGLDQSCPPLRGVDGGDARCNTGGALCLPVGGFAWVVCRRVGRVEVGGDRLRGKVAEAQHTHDRGLAHVGRGVAQAFGHRLDDVLQDVVHAECADASEG